MRLRNIPGAAEALERSPFVIQNASQYRGNWQNNWFSNKHPLHVEIGMGKGQFLTQLSRQNPTINYVGIEQHSSVLIRAVEKMEQLQKSEGASFQNVALLCMDARSLTEVFASGEVQKIYLNFPDPWPKARHADRRLTAANFLNLYTQILSPDGSLELKTDQTDFFTFSLDQIEACPGFTVSACTDDLHRDPTMNAGNIRTEYEDRFSSEENPILKLIAKRNLAIT